MYFGGNLNLYCRGGISTLLFNHLVLSRGPRKTVCYVAPIASFVLCCKTCPLSLFTLIMLLQSFSMKTNSEPIALYWTWTPRGILLLEHRGVPSAGVSEDQVVNHCSAGAIPLQWVAFCFPINGLQYKNWQMF